ncbi:MAG: acetate--CoA ligase, partial [Thermoguttaceae bacterium]|nr:acetate--CoA ligase [Thermoguttaceae bacterium]
MAEAKSASIVNVMKEERLFPPPAEFSARARIGSMEEYQRMYQEAADDLEGFWGKMAGELHWFKPYDKVLEWKPPFAKWFPGGQTNASYNCLDKHLGTPHQNKAAIIWEGEPGDVRVYTYQMLHHEVCKFANVLKKLGIKKGDVVAIYMPMVPELSIAMLACARIGAVHSVVFGGFSAEAIADRNKDASAKLQITADASWRRGKQLSLKETVDAALAKSPTVEKCIVLKRAGIDVPMQEGRDFWWHELMAEASADCPAEPMDSEAPLFILYTSGSTGKPKGVKHTTAGYNLMTKKTVEWVFDLRDDDIYWCTADIGWITGHSYVVYGPLTAGATVFMYEGAPNWPAEDRWWEIIEKYKITILYTAPTAIRAFIKWGDQWVDKHDLSSLRLLGTVGEGINPEAWMWYHTKIGGGRCPIVDTWWQTETGSIMMTPLPGATPTKPGSCCKPLPGVFPEIVGEDRKPVETGMGGWLTIARPWPSMLRGIWGDDDRYERQYWSDVPGKYLCGDNARMD